jgi:hypothetical protein
MRHLIKNPNQNLTLDKPVLLSPLQDELCTTGSVISLTESRTIFKWSAIANVISYDLVYKNLLTAVSETVTTDKTYLEINLLRNTPYSWYLLAKSSVKEVTSKSDVWKFYISGVGVTSYIPYPAEIISPTYGQILDAPYHKIELIWKGSDVDNDIKYYDVYLGNTNSPPLYKTDLTAAGLKDIEIKSSTTYYWKVVTKDEKGNESDSSIFQFRIN